MSLLVVGSVAFDSVETPAAARDRVVGGSAIYCSYAASYFSEVSLVGVVGEDWPDEYTQWLRTRGIDTLGLETVPGAQTFHWKGKYHADMNDRETLELQLNVFAEFDPELPDTYRECPFVFLANGAPTLQRKVLSQVNSSRFVVADTMDIWIQNDAEELKQLLLEIDGLVLNDSEARLLTGKTNLVEAGQDVLRMGPGFVVIKKGEHGAMFFSDQETYALPAFPTDRVVDPTGAGDSFAGGMMGYLASQGEVGPKALKAAIGYGTIVASYNVEDFSLDRMKQIEQADLVQRMERYQAMLRL